MEKKTTSTYDRPRAPLGEVRKTGRDQSSDLVIYEVCMEHVWGA